MKKTFGTLPDGRQAQLYTICGGGLRVELTDFGATLVRLYVPDRNGQLADVILGYDNLDGYLAGDDFHGTIVGRNSNRVGGASFQLGGVTYTMGQNENTNNLHSGLDYFCKRLWQVMTVEESKITFRLDSPHLDQGFPGNAVIHVTYSALPGGVLKIDYEAVCDQDTIFNFTNHSYFNLAGHSNTEAAMGQILMLPARFFTVTDDQGIPTGELADVAGTPMDFRVPKPIGRDIDADYQPLKPLDGYDHNFEVHTSPAAVLKDPISGRCMTVVTDRPGIQFYAGNALPGEQGKDGTVYCKRSGVCLETQFYPDAIHHPQWPQPVVKAGQVLRSTTSFIFTAE